MGIPAVWRPDFILSLSTMFSSLLALLMVAVHWPLQLVLPPHPPSLSLDVISFRKPSLSSPAARSWVWATMIQHCSIVLPKPHCVWIFVQTGCLLWLSPLDCKLLGSRCDALFIFNFPHTVQLLTKPWWDAHLIGFAAWSPPQERVTTVTTQSLSKDEDVKEEAHRLHRAQKVNSSGEWKRQLVKAQMWSEREHLLYQTTPVDLACSSLPGGVSLPFCQMSHSPPWGGAVCFHF